MIDLMMMLLLLLLLLLLRKVVARTPASVHETSAPCYRAPTPRSHRKTACLYT
jgi:hypothetical protein